MRLKNDTENFAASFNITPPYQMRVIHSSKLIYPREIYQRGVQRKRVELIAADFNEYVANEPKISFRNGKYYVVDGQHTIEARILRNGGRALPILCKVYTGMTMQQEALLFAEQNGHSAPLSEGIKLRAKVAGDDAPYNVRHPGQCDGQSGYGVTKLDAIVESIVCTKFSEILECSKSKLLQDMLRKDMEVAQKEVSRAKSELDLKDDERNALKDEMIRVIRGKSSIDRDMIQQLLDENQAAIQAAQDALTAAQNKLEEIEQENKKAENDCINLFTWASTYQNASFQQRQAILNQFIKEVRVGRDYDIEIILNVPLEEFEEFKSHSLSVRTPSGRKMDLKQAPVRGLGTPNGGIVVFDKTSGEAMNIMPKSSAHVTLRCQDE